MPRRLVALLNALTAGTLLFLAAKVLYAAGLSAVTLGLACGLGILSALAATGSVGIWRGTRAGALLTLIVQGSLLLQMETTTLTYLTSLPIAAVIGLGPDGHLHWLAAWRPALEITPDSYRPAPWVGINLPAMAAVVVAALALHAPAGARPSVS
jgi:hypothetical protein